MKTPLSLSLCSYDKQCTLYWWNTAIFHEALDWAIELLYLVWESCHIISQAILTLEVCEIWCFLGPKTDPTKGSLVKSTSFISDFCYSAFSLKSLCSISCIYSCSWHTGSVLWACGMSSCFCLWIGSYHKNAHSPNALFNTSKSMRKVMTLLCSLARKVYIFLFLHF